MNDNFTIKSIEEQERNIDQEALPLFGENNDQLLPFWDWVEIDCESIAPNTMDSFHLRWHHLMVATAEMSEPGFAELCESLTEHTGYNETLRLLPRSFIELWTIARKDSKEVKAVEEAAGIEGEENDEVEE